MRATRSGHPRLRTTGIAVTAAAGLVVSGVVGAASGAADPAVVTPPGAVLAMPGAGNVLQTVVGDDALYVVDGAYAVYRRSLASAPDGSTTLGPAEFIGRSVYLGSVAEHHGTLAYARMEDGALTLRAPDGTETQPFIYDIGAFANGTGILTDHWVTPSNPLRVFSLDRGTELNLAALWAAPSGATESHPTRLALTDDRLLWSVTYNLAGVWECAVLTVALSAAGPVGEVAVVDETAEPGTCVTAVGISGEMLVWDRHEWPAAPPGPSAVVRWYPKPPYTGVPNETADDGPMPGSMAVTGTQVVVQTADPPSARLEWHDLAAADPAAVVHSAQIPSGTWSVRGPLLAYVDPWPDDFPDPVRAWFTDVSGGRITADQTPAPPIASFKDIGGYEVFAGPIMWLADRAVIHGYADGTFRPQLSVNRGATAAFLYRLAHEGTDAPACARAPFRDVAMSHPFCGEITWLASTGITTGWPDGTFRPGSPVSRAAMAAFLYRFAHDGDGAPGCSYAPFVDVAVSHPFCGEITWLTRRGIATGWPDMTFRPHLAIERQAMASFLYHFVQGGWVPTRA